MEILIGILSDFIHVTKFMVICNVILNLKRRKNRIVQCVVIVVLIGFSMLIDYTSSSNIAFIEYLLFVLIFIILFYDENIKKILVVGTWLTFLIAMFDEMSLALVNAVFEIVNVQNEIALDFFTQIITLLFVIIVANLLMKKSERGFRYVKNIYLIYFTIIVLVDMFSLVILADFATYIMPLGRKIVFEIVFVIVILGIFVQMAMLLLLIVSRDVYKEKEALMEKYLNEQTEHYEYLELRERETKRFRHDIRSHLYVLRSLYEKQEYEEFDKYLEKIEGRIEAFGNKISVNNSIVDAVLNKHLLEAEQKHIHLEVAGHFPTKCSVSAFDLCTIVSNLLSNAIEAAHRCGGDQVQIAFRYNEQEILILVENDYDGVILFEGDVMKTRKEDKNSHGFGLENIEECVKRNGGYMNIQTENCRFKTMLLLKNDSKEAL